MLVRSTVIALSLLSFSIPVLAESELATPRQKQSYVLGIETAKLMSARGYQLLERDQEAFLNGLNDALSGGERLLSTTAYEAMLAEVMQVLSAKRREHEVAQRRANQEKGRAFLTENARREGVQESPTGLQYQVVEPGDGAFPKPSDVVVVHYRGMLLDGTEFDSSYARNQPARFRLDRVIPGWTEGLQRVREGGVIHLYIPPELAYGERGAGQQIGPNETLVFEVNLRQIQH